ncbi:MAG TPA: 3-isopropylmalate dehydratase [Clostridiales bacterium]|nr:3-isopropylmalate dehydratase [Clostridiales bacterium]
MDKIKGKAFIFGENIDTDQILPGYAMSVPPEELGNYALKGSNKPDFPENVSPGDIILAEDNFGCGSSREQAPLALKNCGLGAVIAGSFARIFRRNAINIGLPVLESKEMEKIVKESSEGDLFEINIDEASLINLDTGHLYNLVRLSDTTYETLQAGGLINKVKKILVARGEHIEQ